MRKGTITREAILNASVELASRLGLEGVSIGGLAANAGMSKSGLIAHFGTKENLQLATLSCAQQRFQDAVLSPALQQPRGLPRLRALLENWLGWLDRSRLAGGCVMLGAVSEYDDRPGPLRDGLESGFRKLRGVIAKAVRNAVDEGHLVPDTDPWQFAFELFGIILASAHDLRLHADSRVTSRAHAAFDRLVVAQSADAGPG